MSYMGSYKDRDEAEESKVVVAFVVGLAIGGLLIWVFSSTPSTSATCTAVELLESEGYEVIKK